MIEVPRGALAADEIAQTAECFSFGTNDRTRRASQPPPHVVSCSRDDSGSFLPPYAELDDWKSARPTPSPRLTRRALVSSCRSRSRRATQSRPGIKLGICGEHGWRPVVGEFLPQDQADLRELLTVPRPGGPSCRLPGRPARGSRRCRQTGEGAGESCVVRSASPSASDQSGAPDSRRSSSSTARSRGDGEGGSRFRRQPLLSRLAAPGNLRDALLPASPIRLVRRLASLHELSRCGPVRLDGGPSSRGAPGAGRGGAERPATRVA
jgi:hypothetical protein